MFIRNPTYIKQLLVVFNRVFFNSFSLFLLFFPLDTCFGENKADYNFPTKELDENFLKRPISNFSLVSVPRITAKSWVVVDVNSEQIIGAYNPEEKIEPASLTKIMTAYIIFNELNEKRLDLDQEIQISDTAWRTGGSRMFVEPRVPATVHELAQGMIVQSGNDASVALAEAVSGSEESFVNLMNEQACHLGMKNTHFENSTGLPDPKHITTAIDLSKLSIRLIKDHCHFFHYYKQKSFTYNNISQFNRNRLLWTDPTIDGMKTGHTESAGYCLISTAIRGGRRILAVVLGAESEAIRTQESLKLLNWSFQNFETIMFLEKHEKVLETRVWEGKKSKIALGSENLFWLTIPRGRYKDVSSCVILKDPVVAPLNKGESVGVIEIILDEKILRSDPLVTLESIERSRLFKRLLDSMIRWLGKKNVFFEKIC